MTTLPLFSVVVTGPVEVLMPPPGPLILPYQSRASICSKESFAWRIAASRCRAWIIMNQLGRRNLTEEQRSYLRGKRHSEEKKENGKRGQGKKLAHSDTAFSETRQRIAHEFKVAPSTIVRDAKFAEAVDMIAAENGPEARVALLSPDLGLSKKDTIRLVTEPPEVRAEIIASKKKRAEWKKTPEPITDAEVTGKQVAAVMAAWNRCGPEAREIILAKIAPSAPSLRVIS